MIHRAKIVLLIVALCGCDAARIRQLEADKKHLEEKLTSASLALQEKCAEGAARYFSSPRGLPDEKGASYTNHYSLRYKKCFVSMQSLQTEKGGYMFSRFLADAFEGTDYGQVSRTSRQVVLCRVKMPSGEFVDCQSDEEFQQLTKEYMEK